MTNEHEVENATAGWRAYTQLLHGMVIFAFIIVLGLAASLVYEFRSMYEEHKQLKALMEENNTLKYENMQLRDLSKDKLSKIKKSATYIEKNYNKESVLAQKIAMSEMLSAMKNNIDLSVGLALTEQESSFEVAAISSNQCCIGLKGIAMKTWSKHFNIPPMSLYDPETNIRVGYAILSQYREETGSLEAALARYYGSADADANAAYAQSVLKRAQKIQHYLNS